MHEDPIWKSLQVLPAFLADKSVWLSEERNLHDASLSFFRDAGKLLALARCDYTLSNLSFFMAILGLERSLKLHFKNEQQPFKELLQKAVDEGLINDSIFHRIVPLSKDLLKLVDEDKRHASHSQRLVSLIPELRNRFFHGTYCLMPEFLLLTLQLREIADVLHTRQFPNKR
jgi:hypothetical protein